jgi:hypothetical protein
MIYLTSTSDKVEVITSSTADVEVTVEFVDMTLTGGFIDATKIIGGNDDDSITTATTTKIVDEPASGHHVLVKRMSFYNKHASTANTITVQRTRTGPTTTQLYKITLLAGESLTYKETGEWVPYDANGAVKMGASAASSTVAGLVELADAAEMETGTDTARAVVPGLQHRHPGHPKAWVHSPGTGAAANASFGLSSITDTGAGDATFNWATAFSTANYALSGWCERINTNTTVTDFKTLYIRNAGQAAGSVRTECYDDTATNHTIEDPQTYHIQAMGDQ